MISNKILIVDDEIEIIELLETVLKHEGFSHIFHATTGTEALSLLKALNPDLVLLDVMLPDLSGHQLIKEIHQHRQIPVLFISAKTEEFDRLLGLHSELMTILPNPLVPKKSPSVSKLVSKRQPKPSNLATLPLQTASFQKIMNLLT